MPAAILIAGCASTGTHPHTTATNAAQSSNGWQGLGYSPTPAPPAPSPDGTYVGACDYTLNSNWNGYGPAATATGDMEVHNTGNIGTVDRLRITWPQQGYNPLVMHRTIRLAAGASRDIQFHMPLSENQISNLQNWQSGHSYASGCTYRATMIATFGSVSG